LISKFFILSPESDSTIDGHWLKAIPTINFGTYLKLVKFFSTTTKFPVHKATKNNSHYQKQKATKTDLLKQNHEPKIHFRHQCITKINLHSPL
jgi:hypothetical protein